MGQRRDGGPSAPLSFRVTTVTLSPYFRDCVCECKLGDCVARDWGRVKACTIRAGDQSKELPPLPKGMSMSANIGKTGATKDTPVPHRPEACLMVASRGRRSRWD